jgi:hypothetical protein
MDENNLHALKNTLLELGFGTKLHNVLETAIRLEMPTFSLGIAVQYMPLTIRGTSTARMDNVDFRINFSRSKKSDMYFLDNYRAHLIRGDVFIFLDQTFDFQKDHRITASQAHRLLSGLSFEKTVELDRDGDTRQGNLPQKIPMWFKLDLDVKDAFDNHPLLTFTPDHGYDLENVLDSYPIRESDTSEQREDALLTLRNGYYFRTEMKIGKETKKVSIAANPQMKTIDVFDEQMVRIPHEAIFPQQQTSGRPWEQDAPQETGTKRRR